MKKVKIKVIIIIRMDVRKERRGGVDSIKGMYKIADLRDVSSNLTQP